MMRRARNFWNSVFCCKLWLLPVIYAVGGLLAYIIVTLFPPPGAK